MYGSFIYSLSQQCDVFDFLVSIFWERIILAYEMGKFDASIIRYSIEWLGAFMVSLGGYNKFLLCVLGTRQIQQMLLGHFWFLFMEFFRCVSVVFWALMRSMVFFFLFFFLVGIRCGIGINMKLIAQLIEYNLFCMEVFFTVWVSTVVNLMLALWGI